MYKTCERLFLRRFFFSLFLFPQRKNSFLKSSWQKTGCTSRIISREVLVAPTSVLLWSFSSMLSKNHILSKPVMNVVHQMRMKNQIHCLKRSGWLFPSRPLPITWSSLSTTEKLIFRIFYVLYHIQVSQEWVETMRLVSKHRRSRPEELYKNQSAENVRKFLGEHPLWGPVSVKLQNEGLKFSITSKQLHRSNQQHHFFM